MSHDHNFSSTLSDKTHLRVDGLSFSFSDRRVLTNVSFTVSSGDIVGLIGENGSGKSTLLKLISGHLEPAAGTVEINTAGKSTPSVGLLHQSPPFSTSATVSEAIEDAVAAARHAVQSVSDFGVALARDPENPSVTDAYAAALEAAERLDAWEVDSRISEMLSRLGLDGIDQTRTTGSLSGGQRSRLALAWLLLNAPDVLLLDEPTNHLDDAAVDFVSSVLRSWRGAVLIASHDRAFLDDTVTSLIDLDPSMIPHSMTRSLHEDGDGTGIGITRFTGTYSNYISERSAARQRWARQYRDEQAELAKLRATVKDQQVVGHADWKPRTETRMAQKFYADRNAKVVARRVNDARTRLAELEDTQIRKPPAELIFRGIGGQSDDSSGGTQEPVIVATNLSVSGRLPSISLNVTVGEKWLITGRNGSGKSTLLSVLAGKLQPDSGHVWTARNNQIALLGQDSALSDPPPIHQCRTVLETYTELVGVDHAHEVPLSTFGLIAPRDMNRFAQALSVGQQRRLELAALLAHAPDILLLDEPTNHLSLSLVTALEASLTNYPGTVIIASHDRWLRERWNGNQLVLTAESS